MALVYFDGFETAPNLRPEWSMGGTTAAAAVTGRDGVGKALSLNGSWYAPSLLLSTPISTAIVGFAFYGNPDNQAFFSICGNSNTTYHLSLNWTSDGRLRLSRAGTTLGTSAAIFNPMLWHWFEIKATIADSGGMCIVKVDGAEVLNFTGDTRNGGVLETVSGFAFVMGTATWTRLDDFVVCDATGSSMSDFFGEKVVRAKRPSGNGSASQWVGSDGNSTDNYALVDEVTWDTADYVAASASGYRDLYAMGALSGLATVNAVQTHAYVAKSDAGLRALKIVTRASTSGTAVTSSSVALGTGYQVFADEIRTVNPDGNAWTVARANDIEVGVEVV